MKTEFKGIPLNCSIAVPVWHSIKRATMMLHEKHDIENKWPNIPVENKSRSIERYYLNETMLLS